MSSYTRNGIRDSISLPYGYTAVVERRRDGKFIVEVGPRGSGNSRGGLFATESDAATFVESARAELFRFGCLKNQE